MHDVWFKKQFVKIDQSKCLLSFKRGSTHAAHAAQAL